VLIDRISRPEGARIDDLTRELGWLPHTVRAALTGLRRKGYVIMRTRADGEASVYRAEPLLAEKPAAEEKLASRSMTKRSTQPTMKRPPRVEARRAA